MKQTLRTLLIASLGLGSLSGQRARANLEAAAFRNPPASAHPETWFHLIGGNVDKAGLTADLEAVAGAGLAGIQLFHGKGRPWPGVTPQIPCLSDSWEDMIAHVGRETERLGLTFTMQNCPGWAMSGGPWITPDRAMRHLVWSRQDLSGGRRLTATLERPQPSDEPWRDYRDIAVLAFPTPAGDTGQALIPATVTSNRPELPWTQLLAGGADSDIRLTPDLEPAWVELTFAQPVVIRSLALPPVELLTRRRNFDPNATVHLQVPDHGDWADVAQRRIPRGTWQDRQPEMALVLAFPDRPSTRFRLVFSAATPLALTRLELSSAARLHDWRGQAGFSLRSLDRSPAPAQDRHAWVPRTAIRDLTDRLSPDGSLTWEAPPGPWTVVRFGHVNTGARNKPAPPEATGFECDKLSPAGAEQHFAGYLGRVTRADGPVAGILDGMLIDSWECYTQTWTPAMETAFQQRRGYALRPWLPALAGWVLDDHRSSERFLRDWRATISDLLVENYFGHLAELAHARGLRVSFETACGDVSPGDILQYFSRADVPMCEFWQPNDPHWGGLETKPIAPAASAAHLYGKPRLAAEAFTNIGLRWDEQPAALKHVADLHFTRGVTHLVFHTYTHNPRRDLVPGTSFGGRIGTPFLRGQTWWRHLPHFTTYLARCQVLLEQGRPVADVLWYLGDEIDHKPRQDTPFPAGTHFDYLNADVLQHRLVVRDGTLRTPEGLTWRVLWLPDPACRRLTPATLTRLQALLQAGATVIGAPPTSNPSRVGGPEAEATFDRLVAALWGAKRSRRGDRRIGAGRLLWGDPLDASLRHLGIAPDVAGARAATWCHRRTEDAEIYFVAAGRLDPLRTNLHFRAHGRPELWDPRSGSVTPAPVFAADATGTAVALDLPATGSVFVVFRGTAPNRSLVRLQREGQALADAEAEPDDRGRPDPVQGLTQTDVLQPWIAPETPTVSPCAAGLVAWTDGSYEATWSDGRVTRHAVDGTAVIALEGPWTLSFPPGWDTPAQVDLTVLQGWSQREEPAVRAFSGTATYETRFELPPLAADARVQLDLGRVADIAVVTINGRTVATLWAPPFRVDISAVVTPGANRLRVAVTNTWHNRLAYDAGLPEAQRRTWTYNAPSANAPVLPAGLLGPVRLRCGRRIPLDPASR